MKQANTTAGSAWTVTSPNGCTVTDNSGLTLGTVEAGQQKVFVATGSKLMVDDDSARITATFNSAPAKLKLLGLLGGGSSTGLPRGYLAAEFLESTGSQWLTTGIVPTNMAGFRVRLSGPLSSSSGWGYLLGTQNVSGSTRFYLAHASNFAAGFGTFDEPIDVTSAENEWAEVNYKNSGLFKLGGKSVVLTPLNFTPLYEFVLFKVSFRKNEPSDATKPIRIFEFELSEGEQIACKMLPAIDENGKPCMFDKVSKQPFYNSGTREFIIGFSLEQARNLRKLPKSGGNLAISLPSNYTEDADVMEALAMAEANGWVFEYRTYDDTATVSTFALRRIYVRYVQDDLGNYVNADGVRYRVEWCEGVLGAEPEALGYELFRSVEAACDYWGLTEYVDPAEENLLTE